MCIDVMIIGESLLDRSYKSRSCYDSEKWLGWICQTCQLQRVIHIAIDPERLLCFHDNEPPSINHASASIVSA